MVIVVGVDHVRLDEPDDCTAFKVVVEAGTHDEVDEALSGVGRMVDAHTAWIRADALRHLADGRVPDAWAGDFAAMLEFAATKGWLSDDGHEVQAHIEWPSE